MAFRIMTYNILDGGVGRERHIQDVVQAAAPDVLVLQEACPSDLVPTLARSLHADYFIASGHGKRKSALLSRLPITRRNSFHRFPPIHRSVVEAEIEYAPNRSVGIFGVHLIPYPSILFELWRSWEVKAILGCTRRQPSLPTLVLGDFNTNAPDDNVHVASMPWYLKLMILIQGNRIFRFAIQAMLMAGFSDCFRKVHADDDGFTLPPPRPNARLDYIFADTLLSPRLRECAVVREPVTAVEKASDHYPVMAVFDLGKI